MDFIQILCYTKTVTGQRGKTYFSSFIFCVSVKVSAKRGHLSNSMSVTFNFQLSINNCVIPRLVNTQYLLLITMVTTNDVTSHYLAGCQPLRLT